MKSNMKRKFLLLAILGILVFVYCIQIAFTGKNKVRTVSVKDDPDSFEIQTGSAEVVKIYKDGDAWFVGDEKFAASTSVVDGMCSSIKNIRLLGTVVRGLNGDEDRYGLDDSSRTVVTAYKDGKKLQSIIVGKNTSTNSQSYVQLSGGKDVYLSGEALHTVFAVDKNAVRSKLVYSFDSSDATGVAIAYKDDDWNGFRLVKDDSSWEPGLLNKDDFSLNYQVRDVGIVEESLLDSEKVVSWIQALSSLNAMEWNDLNYIPAEGDCICEIVLYLKDKTVSLKAYENDGDYFGVCSESAYSFKMAPYLITRLQKTIDDLIETVE